MKKALLVTESSVYRDGDGELIARGGGEKYMHFLAESLLKMGIKPYVFAIQEFEGQVENEVIDGVFYERYPVYSRSSLKIIGYLKNASKKSKEYDFVFLNQFTPHLILPFLKGNKSTGIVFDIYRSNKRFFWIRQYGFFRGSMGAFIERLQIYFDKKYADKMLTISDSSEEKILKFMGESVKNRVHKNPFPIDREKYSFYGQKEDFLLFVGRFVDYKHPEHVLYVLKEVKKKYPFKAVFVCSRVEPAVLKNFERVRKELGISSDDIKVKTDCGFGELKDLFARAKVFVQPSYVEGQGIVVLEALASGTPVVAYDLPAYKGMISNGENAILVEKGFKKGLCRACVDVLSNYDYFQGNCDKSLKNFSEEMFLERMKDICEISA